MILRVLLVLAIGLKLAGVAKAEYFDGLVVHGPDYKNLQITVENINENTVGITKKDIETEIKLLCLQNGIKASFETTKKQCLYVNINILKKGNVWNVELNYKKFTPPDIVMHTGPVYTPDQGNM